MSFQTNQNYNKAKINHYNNCIQLHMGNTTSLTQQQACCGLCKKNFDYKRAMLIFKKSLDQYQTSLHKNIDQFKQKDQKIVKHDLTQVKQEAFYYLKNDQQLKAKKVLTDFFNQQKQPKLITREIDFLDNKQKMLNNLRKEVDTAVEPYKAKERRNQIIQFDKQLQKIKSIQFNPHQDQKSGDSGDVQAYIDRIMDQLKRRIPAPPVIERVVEQKKVIIKQEPVYIQPSSEQYRERFLRKLWKYRMVNGQRFRRLTSEEIDFFRKNFGIELTENNSSSIMRKSKQGKRSDRQVWYAEEQGRQINFYDGQDINSMSQINDASKITIDNKARGYYLNCNGFQLFDMQQFIKSDWPMIEVLDLQQCGISSHWWKVFVKGQRKSVPNLKILYLGLNQIMQINPGELQLLDGVEYLSFGWWNESNQLTDHSKRVISQFQSKNPRMKIEFPET